VATSRGRRRTGTPQLRHSRRQAGRAIVLDRMIANDSWRILRSASQAQGVQIRVPTLLRVAHTPAVSTIKRFRASSSSSSSSSSSPTLSSSEPSSSSSSSSSTSSSTSSSLLVSKRGGGRRHCRQHYQDVHDPYLGRQT